MTSEEMRALVRRHIEQGFNRADWTVCEETLVDDYTARYGAEGRSNVEIDVFSGMKNMSWSTPSTYPA